MILVVTHKEDFTADFVIEKLNNKGIAYYRFNCEDIIIEDYFFESTTDFIFNINGLNEFSSVWFRRIKLPELNTENQGQKLFLFGDFEALYDNFFQLVNTKRWLSHPSFIYKAENKLYQLSIAKSIGFKIPNTLVTNSHKRLKEFIFSNNQKVIIKPIRQGRINLNKEVKTIFTNVINSSIITRLDEYDLTPCIVQNYVPKRYELRITVVGEKVFAARVNSQENASTQIDWRREKIPFEEYKLPKEIGERCVLLTRKLNLSFGAIDLIKDENGDYIFLEINPNGQWAWIEMETGLKISDEIINYLTLSND